jgi:beta-glucanase (GH16 family)
VFDSEFNGSSLDTSQWSTGWFGSGITGPIDAPYELNVYSPAQVTVSGGSLHLTAVAEQNTDSNGTFSYTSGVVTTMAPAYPWTAPALFSFTYGYMEARIWMPGTSGVADWPIFWAHGFSPDATNGEIDVAEGIGGSAGATFHNLEGAQGTTFGTGPFTGGWHTFGADWEPRSITYYYDGVKVAQYTSGITASPMYLVLNLAISTMLSSPVVVPATMLVDYVRVWQH